MIKTLFLIILSFFSTEVYLQSNMFKEIELYTDKPTDPHNYISVLSADRIAKSNIKSCQILLITINYKTENKDTIFDQKFEYYRNGFLKSWQNSPNPNSVKTYPEVNVSLDLDSLIETERKRVLYGDSLVFKKEYYSDGTLKITYHRRYNKSGRIILHKGIEKRISALNAKYYFFYDNLGRLVKEESFARDWPLWYSFLFKFEYKYDKNGNLEEVRYFINNKKNADEIYKYQYSYW